MADLTLYQQLVQIDKEALEEYLQVEVNRQRKIGEAYKTLDKA